MRVIMSLLVAVIAGCSYTPESSNSVPNSGVGATGNLSFDHVLLGGNKHLVTVTAAPGLMETESSIAQRIHLFANKFAAERCLAGFDFVHDPNFAQKIAGGFMKRTRSYVFVCET